MADMKAPEWLAYPGSEVRISLGQKRGRECIRVVGNPQGLASMAGVLLWLQSFSNHGGLSLSALPFAKPEGSLALAVVIGDEAREYQGRVVRVDRDRQFEWQITDERLATAALVVHRLATNADYVGYSDANVSPDSDALLTFEAAAREARRG
jgi:hypothetical protein